MTQDVAPSVASHNKRALIVDDSPTACAVLKRMLRNYQINADSVQSAEAALDYLKLEKPDVIFMDHAMPGMNGLDTLKVLKAHPEYATIPVMMYTARTGEVYLSQARAFGAIDVLPKGVEQTVLEEALQRLRLLPNSGEAETPTTVVVATPPAVAQQSAIDSTDVRREIERVFRSELRPAMSHQIHDALDEWRHEATLANRRLAELVAQRIGNTVSEAMKPVLAELDWQRAEQQRQARGSTRRFFAAVAATLLLGSSTAIALWSALVQHNNQFSETSQRQTQQLSAALDEVKAQLQDLAHSTAAENTNAVQHQTHWLLATNGRIIGIWAGINSSGSELMVISRTGYRFLLSREGVIASRLPAVYFLTPGCFGDVYAPVHAGMLMRGEHDELWYSPLDEDLQTIEAFSLLDIDGRCQPLDRHRLSARKIVANDNAITDIDRHHFQLNAQFAVLANAAQ